MAAAMKLLATVGLLGSFVQASPGVAAARDVKPSLPAAPGTINSCTFWWDNDGSIACKDMPGEWGISTEKFLQWNPSITSSCGNYVTGLAYCVEATEAAPTTTSSTPSSTTTPGNGIQTPQPTQPGMVGNCNKFYFVKSGDSCFAIAASNSITEQQFSTWNPTVGSTCGGLWASAYVCVGTLDAKPPTTTTTTTPPTTTKPPGNGIATPQPTQPNMISNCDKFYFVKSGDSCASVASANQISESQFTTWNPSTGTNCAGLWANAYACVHAIGAVAPAPTTTKPATPTTTAPGNGIATPSPTQPGMVSNCDKFHFVNSGEICVDIAAKYGISTQQIIQWNTSVGSSCSGMWANAYICVHRK